MNTKLPDDPPLVRLTPKIEFVTLLIKEELKNLKFINDLDKAGIDASAYLVDFSTSILSMLKFSNNITDDFWNWYLTRQNQLVKNIDPKDDNQCLQQAFNFYVDLVIKKRTLDQAVNKQRS